MPTVVDRNTTKHKYVYTQICKHHNHRPLLRGKTHSIACALRMYKKPIKKTSRSAWVEKRYGYIEKGSEDSRAKTILTNT